MEIRVINFAFTKERDLEKIQILQKIQKKKINSFNYLAIFISIQSNVSLTEFLSYEKKVTCS